MCHPSDVQHQCRYFPIPCCGWLARYKTISPANLHKNIELLVYWLKNFNFFLL